MPNGPIPLRVLILKEGTAWVAQCLERDVAAHGATIDEAQKALAHVFAAQVETNLRHDRDPFDGLDRAPDWYWRRFEALPPSGVTFKLPLPSELPVAEAADVRILQER